MAADSEAVAGAGGGDRGLPDDALPRPEPPRAWSALEDPGWESRLFVLEIMLMAVPMLLLFRERTRQNPHTMYAAVTMFLFGFVVNRLNIAVTGMERASG
jgi:hypothetical protein